MLAHREVDSLQQQYLSVLHRHCFESAYNSLQIAMAIRRSNARRIPKNYLLVGLASPLHEYSGNIAKLHKNLVSIKMLTSTFLAVRYSTDMVRNSVRPLRTSVGRLLKDPEGALFGESSTQAWAGKRARETQLE